jgi:hypothetical protein
MDKKYITLIVDLLKPITEIPQKEINYLESILKTVILKKGEYFSREGVVPNYISFFIVKGLMIKA